MGVLEGIRVVDLSDGVAGAFATKLLAAWGADVIKVELPEGDPTRFMEPRHSEGPEGGLLFAYLNTGKRSVVIEPSDSGTLQRLLETADLIMDSRASEVDLGAVRTERPSTVVCSVTPYGLDGPKAGWKSSALTAFAAGGQMMLCGDEDKPPLKTAGPQASYQAGLHAFSASLTGLLAARRTGRGDHIDISMQEAQAACLEGFGPAALVRGSDSTRVGNQLRAIWGIYPCADGHIGVAAMARQTASVYRCIGHPELTEEPAFMNLLANPEMNDVVETFIGEWAAGHTSEEVFALADEHRAPFSLIPTPRQLLDSPSLGEDFWTELDHPVIGSHTVPGMPFSMSGAASQFTRAPLLGEHTDEVLGALSASSPSPTQDPDAAAPPLLDGITVLDLSQVWAGPYAARFLGDMGAEVIHIEGPDFPDAVRGVGRGDDPRSFNKSSYFNEYNRNKKGVALDLKRPQGLDAFRKMVANADVVLENWSVGVAESLGIGYDDLRAINPRIVFAQMPAYGKDGPDAGRVGFGPAIEQMGGLVSLQGYEGGPPHRSGISYGDPNAGIMAAGAVALALLNRERTGEGSHVVVRQRDNIVGMIGEFLVAESAGVNVPRQVGNRSDVNSPHNVYRCMDDSGRIQADISGNPIRELTDTWLAIDVASDAEWAAVKTVVEDTRLDGSGYDSTAGRLAARDAIDGIVAEWASTQEADSAAAKLQAAGVNASPVYSPLMLVRDAHLRGRGYFPKYDHPEAGEFETTRPVWRLADRPFNGVRSAPCFGEHNRQVLRSLAGLPDAEIDAVEADGIIVDVPMTA